LSTTVVQHSQQLDEDTQSRTRALSDTESFIVEAPAGAGKTELLTQRFLKLLQRVNEPEEILAITFTNKAASEMRARILDSLQDAADDVPVDREHKKQTRKLALEALKQSADREWGLLENPSRLRIYTIDSLSSHLARQMPLMSRFGAQPGVREDATPYYEEAAARTLDMVDDEGVGEVVREALRHFDNDAYRLTQLLAEMLARRDQWLGFMQGGIAPDKAEDALGRLIRQDIELAASFLTPIRQQVLMPLARFAASNLPCEHSIALLLDWETVIPATPEALPMWRALCDLLLTGKDHNGVLRKRLDKNMGMPPTPEAKPYKEQLTGFIEELRELAGAESALAKLRLAPDIRHEDEAWQIIATLGHLLRFAVAQLWLVFQTHGEVDFVEIAQRALSALEDEAGNPTDLALKLDYRIQHLLVDEFQDTSPSQVRLLEHLTHGWQPGDGRTLFAVGDPMQSIYRFRKADVGLFLRVSEQGIGDIELVKLRLCRNNRSCEPVITWINQTFSDVFPLQDDVLKGSISYRPFMATKPSETGSAVYVHPLIAENAGDDEEEEDTPSSSAEMLRLQEANKVIEIIRKSWDSDPDCRIAVLVRARAHLKTLVSQIRQHHPNLRFQAVEIEELAERQVIQDLLSLTKAMMHTADRVHWLAILRAPWCGLTLNDLHALAAGDRHRTIHQLMHDQDRLDAMSEDGRIRLLHLRDVLDEALSQRGRQSVTRWVRGVWLMLNGPDCLWDPSDVHDVQAYFDRMSRLEASGQLSIEQLEAEVQKLYAAPDVESRLQFMTIHKSKGLEFDTVILPGLDLANRAGDQPLLMWEEVPQDLTAAHTAQFDFVAAPLPAKGRGRSTLPTPYDYLRHLEKVRGSNEDVRVLYVAVTRAERCLHLIGVAKRNEKGELQAPKNSFLDMLWAHVRSEYEAACESKEQLPAIGQSGIRFSDFVPQLVRVKHPKMPDVFQLRHHHELTLVQHDASETPDSVQDDTPETLVGTLAHRYLELIMRQSDEAWTVSRFESLKPAMHKWARTQGAKPEQLESIVERTVSILKTTIESDDGRWLLKPRTNVSAELPIVSVSGEDIRTQRLDLTFVEEGIRWIIDYKSTAFSGMPDTQTLQLQAEKHRQQLEDYAKLFNGEGLPIKMAIFFLSVGRMVELD
jgi:ATP-dependent helicase/nuclease subunit A